MFFFLFVCLILFNSNFTLKTKKKNASLHFHELLFQPNVACVLHATRRASSRPCFDAFFFRFNVHLINIFMHIKKDLETKIESYVSCVAAPDAKRFLCALHGSINVLDVAVGHRTEQIVRGRIEYLKCFTTARIGPFAIYVGLVGKELEAGRHVMLGNLHSSKMFQLFPLNSNSNKNKKNKDLKLFKTKKVKKSYIETNKKRSNII